jgi:hypothetical protein
MLLSRLNALARLLEFLERLKRRFNQPALAALALGRMSADKLFDGLRQFRISILELSGCPTIRQRCRLRWPGSDQPAGFFMRAMLIAAVAEVGPLNPRLDKTYEVRGD